MRKLRKVALSLALTCAAILPTSAKASTPNSSQAALERLLYGSSQQQIKTTPTSNLFQTDLERYFNSSPEQREAAQNILFPSPKTLEDYVNFFDRNLIQEGERAITLMKYTAAQNILSKYNAYNPRGLRTFSDTFFPTKEELKIVKKSYLRIAKRTFSETRESSSEIKDLKDNITDFLYGFYLSAKGPEANGHTNIPTLDEETRRDAIERKSRMKIIEETVSDWGRRYRAELGGRFKYDFNGTSFEKLIEGIETEIILRDFQIFGQKFHKLNIRANPDQKVKANLTKLLGHEWYARASIKYDSLPGHLDYTSLLVTKEKENSRLIFSIGSNKQNKFQAAVRYFLRF